MIERKYTIPSLPGRFHKYSFFRTHICRLCGGEFTTVTGIAFWCAKCKDDKSNNKVTRYAKNKAQRKYLKKKREERKDLLNETPTRIYPS